MRELKCDLGGIKHCSHCVWLAQHSKYKSYVTRKPHIFRILRRLLIFSRFLSEIEPLEPLEWLAFKGEKENDKKKLYLSADHAPRHVVKHGLDWICKTWTRFVKHGFVKGGFVKHAYNVVGL